LCDDGPERHPLAWILPVTKSGNPSEVGPLDGDTSCSELLLELTNTSGEAMQWAAFLLWVRKHTETWDPLIRESCLLKPLIPLYLATKRPLSTLGSWQRNEGRSQADRTSRFLALELIALVELGRNLAHVGFSEWLNQRGMTGEDPSQTIQQGLSIDLQCMSQSLWSQSILSQSLWSGVARNNAKDLDQVLNTNTDDQTPRSDLKHHQWWSLAWQWTRSAKGLLIPSGLTCSDLPWHSLATHWKKIHGLLNQTVPSQPPKPMELRWSDDPSLENLLDRCLDEVRADQGILSMVSVRYLGATDSHSPTNDPLPRWHNEWLECMDGVIEENTPIGLMLSTGDLGLVYRDLDRNQLASLVREALGQFKERLHEIGRLPENHPIPWIVGIGSVEAPAKSFRRQQLIDAAARCLENAAIQGAGTIKSIEVF
jgi:hypothetical protein